MTTPARGGGGSRRQANVDGGRAKRYVVKVSDDECAALEAKATEQRVTVPRLMVEMALRRDLGGDSIANGMTETEKRNFTSALWQLQRQVGGCAVNINQIAKYSNQTSAFPDDALELLLVAREVLVRVDEFVAEFFPASQLAVARQDLSPKVVFLDKGWAEHFPSRSRSLTDRIAANETASAVDENSKGEAGK
jgi:hypothetical protein